MPGDKKGALSSAASLSFSSATISRHRKGNEEKKKGKRIKKKQLCFLSTELRHACMTYSSLHAKRSSKWFVVAGAAFVASGGATGGAIGATLEPTPPLNKSSMPDLGDDVGGADGGGADGGCDGDDVGAAAVPNKSPSGSAPRGLLAAAV